MKQIIHIISIACIFFLLGFFDLKAQEKGTLDSLERLLQNPKQDSVRVDILNELSSKYAYISIAKSNKYANEAMGLSKKLAFKKGECIAYLNIANVYLKQNKIKNAIDNYIIALKIAENRDDYENVINAFSYIAYAYILQKRFKEAQFNLEKAINIQKNIIQNQNL